MLILIIASLLTVIVYLERPNNDVKQLQKTYSDFLKEKDRQIEELQNKGSLLFKTAMKNAEKDLEMKKKFEN